MRIFSGVRVKDGQKKGSHPVLLSGEEEGHQVWVSPPCLNQMYQRMLRDENTALRALYQAGRVGSELLSAISRLKKEKWLSAEDLEKNRCIKIT